MLAYAGLLGRSRWQADEYLDFAMLRDYGWPQFFDRLLHWGTRPWSEILLAVEGVAANHLHRPLAGSFTLVLWAGLAAACIGPAWLFIGPRASRQTWGERLWGRLLLGLSIMALCFAGHPIGQVFFWPAGAAAYVPTVAAACLLFWCLADGLRAGWAAIALTLAAGSSEVGLFFTLIFCAVVVATDRSPRRVWWLVPGAALATVLSILLLRGRFGTIEISTGGPYLHHALPSLRHGAAVFAGELLNAGEVGPVLIVAHLAAKLLVFLGGRWWASLDLIDRRASRHLPAFGVALVGSAFVSLAAAFYQFGTLCCQRHQTMREVFVTLALLAAGAWSARRHRPAPAPPVTAPPVTAPPVTAPAALVGAVLLLFLPGMPGIAEAYRQYPNALRARALTWQSGLRAGTGNMTLVLQPDDGLIGGGDFLLPGGYQLDTSSPWYTRGVLLFFGKTHLTVVTLPP